MRRVALIVLDGWGAGRPGASNAVARARTPHLSALLRDHPHTTLGAAGMDVGLPDGQMGNSEVGHLNLGAGRIVYQDLTRINLAIAEGEFFENPVLVEACETVNAGGGALHCLGLLSDGGVHSHLRHLYALLELARRRGVERVWVHAFLDGRDTPPKSGLSYVQAAQQEMARLGLGRIATVCGRFYAMDRDTRWERVERAYGALCRGEGIPAADAAAAVEGAYAAGETDEFVQPRVVQGPRGNAEGRIEDGDGVVFFNFRADRARELTRVFTQDGFHAFDVGTRPRLSRFVAFTQYDETFAVPVAFPPVHLRRIFGEIVAEAGLRQLRIAETEKYAHVTFFFNGGDEKPFPEERRILISSPRDVTTYDQRPEMSAFEVKERLLAEIGSGAYDVIVVNFANLDMVGHTGVLEAAVRAVEAVDTCVGELTGALTGAGYAVAITADHGNAEEMWDSGSGQVHTAHTTNRVPFLLVDPTGRGRRMRDGGRLADVAPTLLELMGLAPPEEMTGRSLLEP